MAFNNDYLSRASVGLNTGMVIADGSEPAAPTLFTYRSAGDAVATIAGANYFADAVWQLSLNDLIYCSGSDAVTMLVVATIDRAAGTITTVSASLTGSVDTANIVDGAVTNAKVDAAAAIAWSKMEALASAHLLVGSAGNVATDVAMSGDATLANTGAITLGTVVNAAKSDTYVPEDIQAGMPVLHVFSMAGGATATRTIATQQKITVVDAWVVLKGLGTASDTITVKNAAGTAITDAIDINDADKTISRAGTIDDAQRVVAAAANLQCTETDGGGSDSPACDVYVLCYVTP